MIHQRVICVPKSIEYQKLLDTNEAKNEQLIEIILSESDFSLLYNNGIIYTINKLANINIDDFEDDFIADKKKIEIIIKKLEKIKLLYSDHQLIDDILFLFNEALNRNTGVYFFF